MLNFDDIRRRPFLRGEVDLEENFNVNNGHSEHTNCPCATCDLTPQQAEVLNSRVIDYINEERENTRSFDTRKYLIPVVFHVRVPQNTVEPAPIIDTNNVHLEDLNNFINTLNQYFDSDPTTDGIKRIVSEMTNSEVQKQFFDYLNRVGFLNVRFVLKRVNWLQTSGITPSFNTTNVLTAKLDAPNNNQNDIFTDIANNNIIKATVLNVWIVQVESTPTGTLLGYANFPPLNPNNISGLPATGADSAPTVTPQTDGIVINYKTIAERFRLNNNINNNLNKTAIHEVGHWLGLRHIWGDNDITDFVKDTPPQIGSNSGNPFIVTTTSNPINFANVQPFTNYFNNGVLEMFFNYMDYVQDRAMCMFTNDQVTRMKAFLEPVNGVRVRGLFLEPEINTGDFSFEIRKAITPFKIINSEIPNSFYSITPTLPTGLTLNTTTGFIIGTPISLTPTITYTLTCRLGANDSIVSVATITNTFTLETTAAVYDGKINNCSVFYGKIKYGQSIELVGSPNNSGISCTWSYAIDDNSSVIGILNSANKKTILADKKGVYYLNITQGLSNLLAKAVIDYE